MRGWLRDGSGGNDLVIRDLAKAASVSTDTTARF
jgi:hypothetical protein